jgi:hypothetical protein
MPTLVALPDGTEVEFPDGMTPEAIRHAMTRQFAKKQAAPPNPVPPPPPSGPQPFDWNRPIVDYGQRKPTAAELLDSGAPLTSEQILAGQGTVGSMDELHELNRRRYRIDSDMPQEHKLGLAQQEVAGKTPDWTPYLAKRVPFSPTGAIQAYWLRKAHERYQAGTATLEDIRMIATAQRDAEFDAEKNFLERGVDLATNLPAVGLEFAATGGVASAGRAALGGAVSKVTANRLAVGAAELAGAGLARAAVLPHRVAEEGETRRMKGDGELAAYAKGYVATAIDAVTEELGFKMPSSAKGAAIKEWAKRAWVAKTGRAPADLTKLASAVGFSGVVKEMLEERVAELAKGVTVDPGEFGATGDLLAGRYQEAATQIASEIVGFAVPGAGMAAAGAAMGRNMPTPAPAPLPRGEVQPEFDPSYQTTPEQATARRKTLQEVAAEQFGAPQPVTNDDLQAMSASQIADKFGYRKGRRKQWMIDQILARPENQVQATPEVAPATPSVAAQPVAPDPLEIDTDAAIDALPAPKPAKAEDPIRKEFQRSTPTEFLEKNPQIRDAVAALPDSPSRGQFAKAVGIPTSTIRSRQTISDYIKEARRLKTPTPAPEPPPVTAPVAAPVAPEAPVAAPAAPEVKAEAPAASPEAPKKRRVYTDEEFDNMSQRELEQYLGMQRSNQPHAGLADIAKNMQKRALKDDEIRAKYKTIDPEGVYTDAELEEIFNLQRLKEFVGPEVVREIELGTGSRKAVFSSGKGTHHPLLDAAKERRDENIHKKKLKEDEGYSHAYKQLPEDLPGLEGLAGFFDVPLPKKGTKARKNLNAEELRRQVAAAMAHRSKVTELKAEGRPLVSGRDLMPEPPDTSEFEDKPFESKTKPWEAGGKGKWVPLGKKGGPSAPLAGKIKKKGRKDEGTFKLDNTEKPVWKGDAPIEDTRGPAKQGVMISGLGTDMPGQEVMFPDMDLMREPSTAVAEKKAAPGWGSIEGDDPKPIVAAKDVSPDVQGLVNSLKRGGRAVQVVEPTTDFHRDLEAFAKSFGVGVVFVHSKTRFAGMRRGNLIALNTKSIEDATEDFTWGIAGHEVAHATGVDTLMEKFGKEAVEEAAKAYYANASKDIRKRLDENKDAYYREGVANIIEKFMRDPKFRSKLKHEQTSTWMNVVSKLWDAVGGLDPKSKQMRTALEILKRARNTQEYQETELRQTAMEAVRSIATERDDVDQMAKDYIKIINDLHRDELHHFKLRERAKSEAKRKLGLDARKAANIENKGKDYSSVKDVDTVGRTLVSEYQELFPGDPDSQDYERIVWDLVREPKLDSHPGISQDTINKAWEQFTAGMDLGQHGDAWEPDESQIQEWDADGFDLFAEGPATEDEEVQRAYGRANPATTVAGREEIMREDLENNAPLHIPRLAAEMAARKRLSGDGAAKERDRFVERFKKNDFTPLNEVDTVVLRKILDMTSLAGALTRGDQALSDLNILTNGYRLSRSEQARAMSLRDPVYSGKGISKEVRNNRAIGDLLNTGVDTEFVKKLIDLLKKNGIDLRDKKTLSDDRAIIRALGIIKAERDRRNDPWKHASDMIYEYYLNSVLSGPQTHVANAVGNSFNSAWINMVERTVEVAVSKATGGKLSDDGLERDFRELGEMYKAMGGAIGTALKNAVIAWKHEFSPLNLYTGDTGGILSVIAPSYKIPGKIGRAVRIPFRALQASDEFARTINAHGAAAIYAYRQGKKNGVAPIDMAEYVSRQVGDYTSDVWHNAMRDAAYAAFQQDGGNLSSIAKQTFTVAKKYPGVRYMFPFSTFLINAFGRAADMTPGLGVMIALINRADQNAKPNWNRVMANQVIAGAVLAAVAAAMNDGDDEEGLPLLTGTKERNVDRRGLQYRTAPPMSIRLGGQYFSYARIEPLNSSLALMVDFLEKAKDGETVSDAAFSSFVGQIDDKNYAQGIEEIMKVINEEQSWADIPAKIAVGFVPNAYRQPTKEARNIVTETRFRKKEDLATKGSKVLQQAEMPYSGIVHRYDIWGDPMRTNALQAPIWARILSPIKVKDTKNIFPADLAIMKWNDKAPEDKRWYPSLPDVPKFNGKEVSAKEYSAFVRESGKLARELVSEHTFGDEPTQEEIDFIQRALRAARQEAKARLMQRLAGEQ